MPKLPRRWLAPSVAGLLLGVFVWLGVSSLEGKSRTFDEGSHLSYGRQILELGSFERRIHQHNATSPWMALNAAPVAIARRLGSEIDGARARSLSRLPTMGMAVLLGLVVFAWARRAFGTAAGLLALGLFCFSPNLLAHARLVTTDVVTSLGVVTTLYAAWMIGEPVTRGRQLWRRCLLAGAALGFALTAKVSAAYLVPLVAVLLLLAPGEAAGPGSRETPGAGSPTGPAGRWTAIARWLRTRRRPAGLLFALYLASLTVVNSVYLWQGSFESLARYELRSVRFRQLAATPLVGRLPLPLPRGFVEGLDWVSADFERPRWSYLNGEYSEDGFPHYYLVAFATKSTLGFLALLLAAVLVVARAARRPGSATGVGLEVGAVRGSPPDAARPTRVDLYLLLPAAFYFLYMSLAVQFQIGLRHLLFVYPLLFVFVSRLAVARPGTQTSGRRRRRWLPALAWGAAVAHAVAAVAVYPHFLPFFNLAAGGPLHGWRYLIDSNLDWGQDRARARFGYLPASEVPIVLTPGGPTPGRVMVDVGSLVGLKPSAHRRYAWLRENFEPVDHVGYTWLVYDVDDEALQRCCAELFLPLDGPPGNLALAGRAIGGVLPSDPRSDAGPGAGDDTNRGIVALERLNDGQLGSNSSRDAARTAPIQPAPVAAWFGIEWREPRVVRRLVAYPTLFSGGARHHAFMPTTARFQVYLDGVWTDLPGGRLDGIATARLELSFPPVSTRKVRLVVERERNHRGRDRLHGRFRAACLELAAY